MLKITEFGDPILRKQAKTLSPEQIKSEITQNLIAEMKLLVKSGEYGVGLAAPQIGKSLALSVITIRPTPSHPGREKFETVIINPTYNGIGKKIPMWEGCMSMNPEHPSFAQTMRYQRVQAEWSDENNEKHKEELAGFLAHVFQHETDHLNGVLFVDLVEDSTTWMSEREYKKMMHAKTTIP